MFIKTSSPSFKPNNFSLCTFYGKETCIAWKDNEFVVFPYVEDETYSTSQLNVIVSPKIVKGIKNFEDRVFIICKPRGIYKLTEKLQLASLSKSGIGLGSHFSKVFTFSEGCITLEDKHAGASKKLFQVSSAEVTSNEFSTLKLIDGECDQNFKAAFLEDNEKGDVCLLSHNKLLYKLSQNVVKLIYNCDHSIQEISSIKKKGLTAGVALLTDSTAVIFIYLEENRLKYDKIYLNYDGTSIQTFCAKIDEYSENCISFIYSTKSKTYQCRKKFNFKSVQNISEEERTFAALSFYKSNFALGLNSFRELCRIILREVQETNLETDAAFVDLKLKMMEGSEVIGNRICEKVKEFQVLSEILEEERDTLKRINMYAYETREKYCPELHIERMGDQKYLKSKFEDIFPINSQIVLSAACGNRRISCIKKVTASEIVINLPLLTENGSEKINVTVDLITNNPKGESVCLIKDFIKDPDVSKQLNSSIGKDNFIKLKMHALKKLIKENKVTIQDLSDIKNSIRREMRNVD